MEAKRPGVIRQVNASSTAKILGIAFENDVYGGQKVKQNIAEKQESAISIMRDNDVQCKRLLPAKTALHMLAFDNKMSNVVRQWMHGIHKLQEAKIEQVS